MAFWGQNETFRGPQECRRGPLRGPNAWCGCVPPRHTVWKCFGCQLACLRRPSPISSSEGNLWAKTENQPSWKFFKAFPEKSIFHIKIWSPTCVLVRYRQDLGWQFLGKCTFLHTLFWPKMAFFWPWGPKFGPKYQKHSVTSCFDPKHDISESKLVPCGNGQFWVLQTPQKPPRAPQGPQGAPGVQKWPKSSITSPVVTIDPKNQTFKGGQFFSVFSLGMTPESFCRGKERN